MKRLVPAGLTSIGVMLAALCVAGCRDQASEHAAPKAAPSALGVAATPLRKVVFVGVDAGDWDIIRPLIAKGRLPHFARLVQEGAAGSLHSLEPMLSPLLWTTMATGKLPEEHGILSFTAYDPKTGAKVPISRTARRVDAFWNMLGDYGRRVDVVGWLATYPAERINGVMVTDRVGYLAYAGASEANATVAGNISPAERAAEIAAQLVKSSAVTYGEFKRFVQLDEPAFVRARDQVFDVRNPVNNMIMLYASAQSYRAIARHLAATDHPDLLAVYFELVDATCHLFMPYAPPLRPGTDPGKYEEFKNAVEEAYVLQDEILGEYLGGLDPNTVLIVASDHGFLSGASRLTASAEITAGKAALWHRLDGILCMYGNGIHKGQHIDAASVADIAPTLLALQGLPKPADMPGKVLLQAFDDSLAARVNTTAVATLQRQRAAEPTIAADPSAQDAIKKLEALGYLAQETPDTHNNLGQRYLQQGEFQKAAAEFNQAIALKPKFPGALNNLGHCYLQLGDYVKAEDAFKKALALKPQDVYALNNLAIVYMDHKDLKTARQYAERAVAIEPTYANGHVTLGSIYGTMHLLDLAEREFKKVLEIDPSNEHAKKNLEMLRQARNPQP
jgi:predicted AlkP superfamily phosphohydrolase/phosphomutase